MRLTVFRAAAFTLIELLVVISVIAVTASLLLPAMASAKTRSTQVQCVNNHRQLTLAWTLYATDKSGQIVPDRAQAFTPGWIRGSVHGKSQGFTDPSYMLSRNSSAFVSYLPNWRSYKCPSERVFFKTGSKQVEKIRSYSMSSVFVYVLPGSGAGLLRYGKIEDVLNPSGTFVFIDVEPASICWEMFSIPYADSQPWWHSPGALHNRGAILSFADGHSERHRWNTPNNRDMSIANNPDEHPVEPPRDRADVSWLRRRSHHSVR